MDTIKVPKFENFIKVVPLRSDSVSDSIDQIRSALKTSKVVKLVPEWHISDLRSFYDEVTERLGLPINIAEDYAQKGAQTGERWMEIRYDEEIPDMVAYRHSKNGQPFHTDESYISNPCEVMVFYSVNKALKGGATVFIDGQALVEKMKVVDPDLLTQLQGVDVPYEKAGNYRCRPIIKIENGVPNLNYNMTCISGKASDEQKELNLRLHNFLELHAKGSYLVQEVLLNPGEGVLWWDHFVLHGRTPFEANKSNDRLIWKTGLTLND